MKIAIRCTACRTEIKINHSCDINCPKCGLRLKVKVHSMEHATDGEVRAGAYVTPTVKDSELKRRRLHAQQEA